MIPGPSLSGATFRPLGKTDVRDDYYEQFDRWL